MAVDMNMPILIVDDYKSMLRVLAGLLKKLDFTNVEEAGDGAEALAKLRQGDFGIVISDWNMAPMTGIELLRRVRADDRLRDMPFILVTAESTADKLAQAREAGASDYIVKPFDADALRGKLAAVLGEF